MAILSAVVGVRSYIILLIMIYNDLSRRISGDSTVMRR